MPMSYVPMHQCQCKCIYIYHSISKLPVSVSLLTIKVLCCTGGLLTLLTLTCSAVYISCCLASSDRTSTQHTPAQHCRNITITYQHINISTYQHHGPGDPPAADRQHAGAGEDGEVAPVPLHTGVSTEYSVTGSHLDIAIKCNII